MVDSTCMAHYSASYVLRILHESSVHIMSSRIFYVIAIIATVLVNSHISVGSEIPVPAFKTTAPENKKIIMESIYLIRSMWYQPRISLNPIKNRRDSSYANPEVAAISHISAGINQDYEWWFETWDPISQKEIRERHKKLNRTPEVWKKRMEKAFKGREVFITSRIETGKYVIIGAQIFKSGAPEIKSSPRLFPEIPIVLKKVGGKWLRTNELKSDPVLLYWLSGGKKKTVFQNIIRR